jgi:hypothetical protein
LPIFSKSSSDSTGDSPKLLRSGTPSREASKDLQSCASDIPSQHSSFCDPDDTPSPREAHLLQVQSLKPGDLVYIAAAPSSHSEEVYHKCKVTQVATAVVSVTLPSGEKKTVPPLDVLPAGSWQPKLSETHDLCALPSLNEATVLAAIQQRFSQRAIYTWIANLLVSVNPCQPRCAELPGPPAANRSAGHAPLAAQHTHTGRGARLARLCPALFLVNPNFR